MEGSDGSRVVDNDIIVIDDNTSVGLDFQQQVSGGISSQLAPEFSRKLSFVECDNDPDVSRQREASGSAEERADPSQLPDVIVCSESDSKTTGGTAGAFTQENKQAFVCSCGETFEKSVSLAAHKRWTCALTEKTSQCDLCKSWFASDMSLKRHMKHAHGGMFSCDSCSLRFPNKVKLTHHWLEAHHNENEERLKLLKCYECGHANFHSKVELEYHLVQHKFEKHQQKFALHASVPHHSSFHFSPYPSPPCLRAMRHPHPFHQPYGFRHPWSHFPFRPPPPAPLFPFMSFPSYPPFHLPVPPTHIPTNTSSFYPDHDDDSPIKSPSKASTPNQNPTTETDGVSTSGTGNLDEAPHNPHHNHEYCEPTAYPYFLHHADHYKHHRHHNMRHHEKKKWKKYLKLMIKGKVPPLWAGLVPPQDLATGHKGPEAQENSSNQDKNMNNCEFKMACKFCEKVIEKNKVSWHQKKECPVLAAHRCTVCDRVFKKRHFLIRHMHEQNHFGNSASGTVHTSSEDVNLGSLSSLQEKMNATLNLNLVEELESEAKETSQPVGHVEARQLPSYNKNEINPELKQMEKLNPGIDFDGELNASSSRQKAVSEKLQCSTCKRLCQSVDKLAEHLREHISLVVAIQKVSEWRSKSSEYFFLEHNDGEDDFEGTGSLSTATTSYLDSEITSVAGSTLQDLTSNFSSLEPTKPEDPKWSKPHRKRDKHHHHHKGEINVCEFCGEKFAFRKDLRYHMDAQHKDSTLECPVCRKKFSWKKRGKFYERHLNSHYGVKVFKHKCDACGKTFLENSKLRAHMSLHNNELQHKCTVCGKGYANKSSLVRHERKHTGVKPYQCEICQEGFSEKRELLRHSTTHTGLAPFSCSECGHGFTLKTSLMSHMKKKHFKKENP